MQQSDQAPAQLSHRQIMEILFGLLAGMFTALLSSTIVSNALPTIIADLDGSQTQYTWVVTASLLAMTVSMPLWGKLSDLVNKKMLIQVALVVFVIGSVLAGAAHNVPWLITTRVVQGLAMGGLITTSQSIIGSIIAPRERGRYSGYLAATMAVATVSGPLAGGIIVDTPGLGWRWCFYVCVPLAVISLIVLHKYLVLPTQARRVRLDIGGTVLIAIAASLPLLWVTFAGDSFAWLSVETALFWAGTLIAVALVIVVESRHPEPLLPLTIVAERTTALAIVGSLAVGMAMFGGSVFLGQYFQVAGGHSASWAGVLSIPLMAGSLVGTIASGQLITRFGRWKRFLVGGSALMIIGLAMLSFVDHTTAETYTMISMAVMGLGMGMLLQNYVLAVQNTVSLSTVGAASATVAFFRSLGGAIGVSVLGALLARDVSNSVTSKLETMGISDQGGSSSGASLLDLDKLPAPVVSVVREAYGDATGHIFLIAAGIAVLSLVAASLIKEIPLRTTIDRVDAPAADDDSVAVR